MLSGVTAGYGAGLILKGVDLTVEAGKIMCLIGPNGAGKSTVLKTISGLLRPKGGQVMLRGEDISRLSSKDRLTGEWFTCRRIGVSSPEWRSGRMC